MSKLEIELTPEEDARIRAEARRRGQEASEYARHAVLDSLLSAQEGSPRPKHNVMEFAGVGREALKDLDVDQFIRDLRDEWGDTP